MFEKLKTQTKVLPVRIAMEVPWSHQSIKTIQETITRTASKSKSSAKSLVAFLPVDEVIRQMSSPVKQPMWEDFARTARTHLGSTQGGNAWETPDKQLLLSIRTSADLNKVNETLPTLFTEVRKMWPRLAMIQVISAEGKTRYAAHALVKADSSGVLAIGRTPQLKSLQRRTSAKTKLGLSIFSPQVEAPKKVKAAKVSTKRLAAFTTTLKKALEEAVEALDIGVNQDHEFLRNILQDLISDGAFNETQQTEWDNLSREEQTAVLHEIVPDEMPVTNDPAVIKEDIQGPVASILASSHHEALDPMAYNQSLTKCWRSLQAANAAADRKKARRFAKPLRRWMKTYGIPPHGVTASDVFSEITEAMDEPTADHGPGDVSNAPDVVSKREHIEMDYGVLIRVTEDGNEQYCATAAEFNLKAYGPTPDDALSELESKLQEVSGDNGR